MDRNKILQRIQKNKPPSSGRPESYRCSDKDESLDLSAVFCTNLKLAGANVFILDNESLVKSLLSKHFPDAVDFTNIETWTQYSSNDTIDKFEALDTIILKSQLGVAENGAVWLDETSFPQRIVPFITKNLVIKLNKKNLVSSISEAYKRIDLAMVGFGVFISGPSKTADIEQVLVFGAHGPLTHTVVIINH